MSVQHYMELESGLSLHELAKIIAGSDSHISVTSNTKLKVDTLYTSFDIEVDVADREKRGIPLGVQTDAILIFWARVYDMGFAKGIEILLNTTMNLAYYYEDMDDPMYYRVDGTLFVNIGFQWDDERFNTFQEIPHELVNLTKPK